MKRYFSGICLAAAMAGAFSLGVHEAGAQATDAIRINQVGFSPGAPKVAAVVGSANEDFKVLNATTGETVFSGKLTAAANWGPSSESMRLAKFSEFKTPGKYQLEVTGIGKSGTFSIDTSVYSEIFKGLSRYYYFNRASTELVAPYAGKWTRAAGHPDDQVRVHTSAVSDGRPANSLINASGGWYDAGDYNKYTSPTAVTIAQMLGLYEDEPAFVKKSNLNLPESGNALPDLIDEALWGARHLMRCQDPGDGGFYHKITSANFTGFDEPVNDKTTRYAVQKSVTGTFAAAAALAKASRVFKEFESLVPGFADSALVAAKKAWDWGLANPSKTYNQSTMNASFTPVINTGEYGDSQASDEKYWAGIELGLATGEATYIQAVNPQATLTGSFNVPGWNSVNTLSLFSLASFAAKGGALPSPIKIEDVNARLTTLANTYRSRGITSALGVGLVNNDFGWGSNGYVATQGLVLAMVYRITKDKTYYDAAVAWLDYLYGRNGTGYSYVTGFGWKPSMFPHHRPSGGDNIADPIPGMLVGGANNGKEDIESGCVYAASSAYAKAYADLEPCYASNEVTIYWNAPAVYLSGLLAAMSDEPSASIKPKARGKSRKTPQTKLSRPGLGSVAPEAVNALGRAWLKAHP